MIMIKYNYPKKTFPSVSMEDHINIKLNIGPLCGFSSRPIRAPVDLSGAGCGHSARRNLRLNLGDGGETIGDR